jgi:hypothetical protein
MNANFLTNDEVSRSTSETSHPLPTVTNVHGIGSLRNTARARRNPEALGLPPALREKLLLVSKKIFLYSSLRKFKHRNFWQNAKPTGIANATKTTIHI